MSVRGSVRAGAQNPYKPIFDIMKGRTRAKKTKYAYLTNSVPMDSILCSRQFAFIAHTHELELGMRMGEWQSNRPRARVREKVNAKGKFLASFVDIPRLNSDVLRASVCVLYNYFTMCMYACLCVCVCPGHGTVTANINLNSYPI